MVGFDAANFFDDPAARGVAFAAIARLVAAILGFACLLSVGALPTDLGVARTLASIAATPNLPVRVATCWADFTFVALSSDRIRAWPIFGHS